MPILKKDMAKLERVTDDLKTFTNKLDAGMKKNSDNIDSLFENQGRQEERMIDCEDGVAKNNQKIKGLDGKTDETNKQVGILSDKLDDANDENRALKQQLSDVTSYFEGEMRKMRELVESNTDRVDVMEHGAQMEKQYLRGFESDVNQDVRNLRTIVEHPGVIKPPMRRMVDACLPFEQLAFSKKYVRERSELFTRPPFVHTRVAHTCVFPPQVLPAD